MEDIVRGRKEAWDKVVEELDPTKDKEYDQGGRNNAGELKRWLEGIGFDSQGKRALDLGCGIGRVTVALTDFFGEAYGCDFSVKAIEKARERWSDTPKVFFEVNDGVSLKIYPDEFFDFVYSVIVFIHIPEFSILASYAKEIGRVLKPGGYFKIHFNGRKWIPIDGRNGLPIIHRSIHRVLFKTGFIEHVIAPFWLKDIRAHAYPGLCVSLKEVEKLFSVPGIKVEGFSGEDTKEFWVWGCKK